MFGIFGLGPQEIILLAILASFLVVTVVVVLVVVSRDKGPRRDND